MYSHTLSDRHTAAVQQWILCWYCLALVYNSETITRLNPNLLPRRAITAEAQLQNRSRFCEVRKSLWNAVWWIQLLASTKLLQHPHPDSFSEPLLTSRPQMQT